MSWAAVDLQYGSVTIPIRLPENGLKSLLRPQVESIPQRKSTMKKLELHWQILIGMILGAIIGITTNVTLSKRQTTLTDGLPAGIKSADVKVSSDLIEVRWQPEDETQPSETWVVDPTGRTPDSVMTLGELGKRSPVALALYEMAPSYAQVVGKWSRRIGGLFLRMLQMVSVPLIITSLASGVLGLGGAARFRRMFTITMTYFVSTSLIAILTGLVVTNIIRPGVGSEMHLTTTQTPVGADGIVETMMQQVESLIPANPFDAVTSSAFLSIISFTIIFCIFVLQIGGDTLTRFRQLAEDGFEVMMRLTSAIIKLAPYGVFLLMVYVTATQGVAVFKALAWYMLAVFSGLAFHSVVTLSLIVWIFARRNPWKLAKACSPALLTAFSSASSNATLPVTLNNLEKRADIPNRVCSFVCPLGATINMDGTALYEAVAVLFIGQLVTGGDMTLTQQFAIAITALMASIGAAGIPHAGLVMMAIVLQAVNLPLETQGIILAVDRILDMCRTSVNVWSDCCASSIVDRMTANDVVDPVPAASPAPEVVKTDR